MELNKFSSPSLNSNRIMECLVKMRELYEEIGFNETEKRAKMKAVQTNVEDLVANALQDEIDFVEDTKREIHACEQNILLIIRDMDQPSLGSFKEFNHLPLRDQLVQKKTEHKRILKEKEEREFKMLQKLNELQDLCQQLETDFSTGSEFPQLSVKRLLFLEEQIENNNEIKRKRKEEIRELSQNFINFWSDLDLDTEDLLYQDVKQGNLSLTLETIQDLQENCKKLEEEVSKRTLTLRDQIKQIKELWEMLEIPIETQNSFMNKGLGLGDAVFRLCNEELLRLRELKASRIKELIFQARQELYSLWEEMGLSTQERRSFGFAQCETYDDETLDMHRREILRLQERLQVIRPITKLINQRLELKQQKMEFEKSVADPTRLLQKSSGSWLQLKNENRQRKKFEKLLPKIEEQLVHSIQCFEKHGEVFTWNGIPYLEQIEMEKEIHSKRGKTSSNNNNNNNNSSGTRSVNASIELKKATPTRTTLTAIGYSSLKTPTHSSSSLPIKSAYKQISHKTPLSNAEKTPKAAEKIPLAKTPTSGIPTPMSSGLRQTVRPTQAVLRALTAKSPSDKKPKLLQMPALPSPKYKNFKSDLENNPNALKSYKFENF